jgi:hypothetical protein
MALGYGTWLDAYRISPPKRTYSFTDPTPGVVPVAPTPPPASVASGVTLSPGFTPDQGADP